MIPNIYIGPAGWSYPDWDGVVYPRRRPARFDPLSYLASYFSLIEINSTFYRIPSSRTCESWARRVKDHEHFVFTAKLFQDVTHKRNVGSFTDIEAFKRSLWPLHHHGRLSAVLVQFPWSFQCTPESLRYVASVVQRLRPFPAAVEVRHAGWASEQARDVIQASGATMCGIDQPLIGESLDGSSFLSGSAGYYFRLHGRNRQNWFDERADRDARYDYLYEDGELDDWIERIDRAAHSGHRVHVVLNNHFRGQAVANALQIMSRLEGKSVPAPPGLARAFAQLSDRFTVGASDDGQGDLFDQKNE